MEWMVWVKYTSEYEEVQKLLIELLDKLITRYFANAGDYVQEKFVKSFAEPVGLLEKNLQYKHGVHPSQLQKKGFIISHHESQRMLSNIEQIKRVLITEMKRQYRHYCLFLDAAGRTEPAKDESVDYTIEYDVFVRDGDGTIGYGSVHHNGEHWIGSMYQDRLDIVLEEEVMFERLSEEKCYISENETPEEAVSSILSFWLMPGVKVDLGDVPVYRNRKTVVDAFLRSNQAYMISRNSEK